MAKISENLKAQQLLYIKMELLVLEAIKSKEKQLILLKQKTLDKKKLADSKYVESLRKNLLKLKKLRLANNDLADIAALLRKIALLLRDTSGKNAKEIAELKKELQEKKLDQYYDKREQAIDDLLLSYAKLQEQYQNEIDALTEANQIKLNNIQLYWDLVHAITLQGAKKVLDFVKTYSDEYQKASDTKRLKLISLWKDAYLSAVKYDPTKDNLQTYEDIKKDYYENLANQKKVNYGLTDNVSFSLTGGKGKNSTFGMTYKEKNKDGKIEEVALTDTEQYALASSYLNSKLNKVASGNIYYAILGDKFGNYSSWLEAAADWLNMQGVYYMMLQSAQDTYNSVYQDPKSTSDLRKAVKATLTKAQKKYNAALSINKPTAKTKTSDKNPSSSAKGLFKWKQYLTGGMVDYTGPAWVDGTPNKPLAFLNAELTQMFKEYANLLSQYDLHDISALNGTNITNNNIGPVYVTIESGVVSNKAQAKNLSEQISTLLMNIARKSGNIGVSRR